MRPKSLGLVLQLFLCIDAVAGIAATAEPDTTLTLKIEVGSRMYTTWSEQLRVRLGEAFYLGDSEYTARIDRFLPDFRIVDGEFISVTQQLANPAARVIVYHDTTATDSTWAFLNFPPHFSPRSFFTFKLLEIQGYVPADGSAVAADSSAAPADSSAAPAPAPTPAVDKPKDAEP
jgi:hypothetical protein